MLHGDYLIFGSVHAKGAGSRGVTVAVLEEGQVCRVDERYEVDLEIEDEKPGAHRDKVRGLSGSGGVVAEGDDRSEKLQQCAREGALL